jgi:3-vinyl bacteriochlorophyllide hydratase
VEPAVDPNVQPQPNTYQSGFNRAGSLGTTFHKPSSGSWLSAVFNDWCEAVAPCPWNATVGLHCIDAHKTAVSSNDESMSDGQAAAPVKIRQPLYTPEERSRRDSSPWTLVQGILAPLQFLAFGISLALVIRYLITGEGYGAATASILVKTVFLYTIMITGSIWEKVVFGKWLFARAFFWEDVFSMMVLGLQTCYLAALFWHWGSPRAQMMIAISAYAAYAINASQFILKLRAARLDVSGRDGAVDTSRPRRALDSAVLA